MGRPFTVPLSSIEHLMKEWDWDKNTLNPTMIGAQCNKKAGWKCQYGHSWEAKINNRYKGSGCPICRTRLKTSFQEQAIYFYVKKIYADAVNGYTAIFKNGMEIDIFIPSIKVGIEYDGAAWHTAKTNNREKKKYTICKDNDICLIRIVERIDQNEGTCDTKILIQNAKSGASLNAAIAELLHTLKTDLDDEFLINTERDKNAIYEQYLIELEKNSLANTYPQIAAEWHPEKNGTLTPQMFLPHSAEKVWWQCKKGHEWNAQINSRTSGRGCPYCSGNYVLAGFNDLATVYPDIAKEWLKEKNGRLQPDQVTFGSGRKVWWICENGHEWRAAINNRTSNNRGCPYCTGGKTLIGVNDLCTVNPTLAKEWHPTKNGNLTPQSCRPNSNIKVWWLCPKCGHEYQAIIANRTKGTGCKNCSNQILHSGINDLATLYPDIARQWDYEQNCDLTPDKVFPSSNKKIWWRCDRGHTWQTAANNRVAGNNCPYCAGNKVWIGFNDLATTHPELSAQWSYEKNDGLMPQMVSKGFSKKVWWKCPKCGCEYQSYIGNRVKGYGCKCSGKRAQKKSKIQ